MMKSVPQYGRFCVSAWTRHLLSEKWHRVCPAACGERDAKVLGENGCLLKKELCKG